MRALARRNPRTPADRLEIAASLLFVIAEESEIAKRMAGELAPERLSDLFRTLTAAAIPGAGHRVHHERPEAVAALLERFLDQSR